MDASIAAPPDGNECFESKDYWLILTLIASHIQIYNVTCEQDERSQNYLMWYFPKTAQVLELERQYNLGIPILLDVQEVKKAAGLFKQNLQYFRVR